MPQWLVTGAAGFIGSALCRRLVDEGVDVVGVDNLDPHYNPALSQARLALLEGRPNFSFHLADVADREALSKAFRSRPEIVVHLAAKAGVSQSLVNPTACVRTNVIGMMNVLEECRRSRAGHLLYASSSSVYGANSRLPFSVHDSVDHPLSIYAATKRSTELMAHTYSYLHGLPTTGMRFFTVYGPWGRPDMAYYLFARAIIERRPVTIYGDGTQMRDFTFVDDIVDGVCALARMPPKGNPAWSAESPDPASSNAAFRVLNIGHGVREEVNTLIRLLESNLGMTAERRYEPARLIDLPATQAEVEDPAGIAGSVPATPVEVGIKAFVDWFVDYHSRSRPL